MNNSLGRIKSNFTKIFITFLYFYEGTRVILYKRLIISLFSFKSDRNKIWKNVRNPQLLSIFPFSTSSHPVQLNII